MLDAHQLNIFLQAAELENFSEAARHLNISQPSVSAQIRSLEQRFDTKLFHRAGRRVTLTEAGQALVPLAQEMVLQSINIAETMASLGGKVIGQLRLGCSTAAGKYALPRLIARFCDQHPHVRVSCNVTSRRAALTALLEGKVHLAVSSAREYGREIEYHHFATDPVVLIVPIDHSWASREAIQPKELLTEDFILREPTSGTRYVLEEGLAVHGIHIDQLKTVMVMANSEAIRTAVEERIGVAFVSKLVAAASIELGRTAEVKIQGMDLKQNLFIGHDLRRPASRAQIAFWQFILDPENRSLLERSD